jgi:hypothetical protein
MANYKFVKEGFLHIIERLEYPKFTAQIDLSKSIPMLENIMFEDLCSGTEMLQAINEAYEFIEGIPR